MLILFMKNGKELKLKLNKNFKTNYGTINNRELKTVYVSISTWVTPTFESDDYTKPILQLKQLIKNGVIQNINPQLFKSEYYIVDIDVKGYRLEYGKSNYLNVEITLFTKNKDSVLSSCIKNDMNRFVNNVVVSMEKSTNFNFTISKQYHDVTI